MSQKSLGDDDASIFIESIKKQKHRLKMLIAILDRDDGERAVELFRERRFRFHFTVLAEGTSRSMFMNLIGLGSTERTIALCVSHSLRIAALLPEVSRTFNLNRPGSGIVFTVPLSGLNVSVPWPSAEKLKEEWNSEMEREVNEMNESINHDLILAAVNHGNSEELVAAARAAGAKGGTVVNARRTGLDDAVKFFGITVQEEREIVAILTKRETKAAIMDKLNESFGVSTPAHGIILSLPVDSVSGIEG